MIFIFNYMYKKQPEINLPERNGGGYFPFPTRQVAQRP